MIKSKTSLLSVLVIVTIALSGCVGGIFGNKRGPDKPPIATSSPTGFEKYYTQEISWGECDKPQDGYDCALVSAPLNWQDSSLNKEIKLALIRHKAPGEPLGSLFVNPGGPGGSGVSFISSSLDRAVDKRIQEKYDVIGFDPRGVNKSSKITCLDSKEMDEYLFGVRPDSPYEIGSNEWVSDMQKQAKFFADACANSTGELIDYVDTYSAARDLDMFRSIVGDTKLNYIGYSYGTFLGAHFANLFPNNVGRLLLDGAIDPSLSNFEVVKGQTIGFENAAKSFLQECINSLENCFFKDLTVDESMKYISDSIDEIDSRNLYAEDGRKLTQSTYMTSIISPLYSKDMWNFLNSLFITLSRDNVELAFISADSYYNRQDGNYLDNSYEAFSAINCLDYTYEANPERMRTEQIELEEIAPYFGKYNGYGDIGCSVWHKQGVVTRSEIKAQGADPIIVIGTTGDPATPYQWAVALANQLESGHMVTYKGEGHVAYSGDVDNCITSVVDLYFLEGKVPKEDPKCSA